MSLTSSDFAPVRLPTLLVAVALVSLSNGFAIPSLPAWAGGELDPAALAALSAAFPLGAACAALPWAHISNRFGVQRVLAFGLVGYVISFAALDQAALPGLFALRFLNGAFVAAVVPSAFSIVAGGSQSERCARDFSWLNGLVLTGDIGAFLASRSLLATSYIVPFGLAVAVAAVARPAPSARLAQPRKGSHACAADGGGKLPYIAIAVAAGGTMAMLHTQTIMLDLHPKSAGALLIGSCGLVMVASQFLPPVHRCIASMGSRLVVPLVIVLSLGFLLGTRNDSFWLLSLSFLLVGWSAALLRLLSTYLAAQGAGVRTHNRMASQFSVINAAQGIASLALSIWPDGPAINLGVIALMMIALWWQFRSADDQ